MFKKIAFVILALAALGLPVAVRWLYFHTGRPMARAVSRPDLADVVAPTPEWAAFVDTFQAGGPGTVLVDRAHDNYVQMGELNVLQARLTARGQRLEAVTDGEDLVRQLRYASALVVISPLADWTREEVELVRQFVNRGGRLLLVADATRFAVLYDEEGDYLGLDPDAVHINSLAGSFGLLFQSDYLYNTVEHETNYRNIRLTQFARNRLTEGLRQVVFYATRSILSQEPALIAATGDTRSSSSERRAEPAVAVLTGGGRVLALGDLTFSTEPYNAVADNDRLVARIADWLSGAERQYGLAEFPHLFADQIDLVYLSDPVLDSDLLGGGSALQSLFRQEGKELVIQADENAANDTLFLGLYEEAGEAEPYLAAAQVTLWPAPTEEGEGDDDEMYEARVVATPALTTTAALSPTLQGRVEIASLGEMVITGTSLLLLQVDGDRHVMVVLAHTTAGLESAIRRLAEGDLEGCVLRETEAPAPTLLALCPTGEVEPGEGEGGWIKPAGMGTETKELPEPEGVAVPFVHDRQKSDMKEVCCV